MNILKKVSNGYFYATNPSFILLKKYGFSPERYQSFKVEWLQELGVKTILDIGANTGQAAVVMCEAFPGANVYSFEPLPDCYFLLKRLEKRYSKLKAFNVALGKEAGKVVFERNSYSPSSSMLTMTDSHKELFPNTVHSQKEEVNLQRLDDIAKTFDINDNLMIKLDVQGYEQQVIDGGHNIFGRAKAVIVETSFEILYEGQALFADTYDKLTKLGFQYRGSFEQLYSPSNKRILQQDALFIKR